MEITDGDAFIAYWNKIRARTRRVISHIPHDRFDWTYRDEAWTFADLIRHLGALERWMFVENALRRPSLYAGCGRDLADGPDEVLAYLDRMHEESVALIESLSTDDLAAHCETPAGVRITVWKWLRAMIEHEVHHRGQIYLMLGILEVAGPPLYGLTSEEVQDRSVS